MVKLHQDLVFNLQAGVFMQKFEHVFKLTVEEYQSHSNETKWDKIKEKLIEFINENNPDKITEE